MMKKDLKMATVFYNGSFFWLNTQAVGMIAVGDAEIEPQFLATDVDDETLGAAVQRSVLRSRQIEMTEFQKSFNSGAYNELDEVREKQVMQKYGYKTKRALYKNMDRCSVDLSDGKIKIQPMHHKSLDGYSATTSGPEPFVVDAAICDAELGAALREAFKRCTSSV